MFDSLRSVAHVGRHRSSGRSCHTGRHSVLAGAPRAAALLIVLVLVSPTAGRTVDERTPPPPRLASDIVPLYGDGATNGEYHGLSPGAPAYRGVFFATGTVTDVTDGDTIRISGVDGAVRILGIDTPETVHPNKPQQCWGKEATQFARDTLLGRTVDLYTDPTQATRDFWDRLLAYVILPNGTNYSIAAATAGFAKEEVFDNNPVRIAGQISAAVQAAQQARLGRWGPPCNEDPESMGLAAPSGAEPDATGSETTGPEPPRTTGPDGTDPRFGTCDEAIAQGYGPYIEGVDLEYGWYLDRDRDGVVCET